ITRRLPAAKFLQSFQLGVREMMPRPGRAVKPVILNRPGKARRILEWIDYVDEFQFFAKTSHQRLVPIAARFPAHPEFAAFGTLEKRAQPRHVLLRRAEAVRALEQD